MTDLSSRLAGLSPDKRALLEAKMRKRAGASSVSDLGLERLPIPRQKRGEAPLPLSFAQERLWLLDQLEPGISAYNTSAPVRILGRLNVPVLAASLEEVRNRNETLRTTFPASEGRPVQAIHPPGPFPLPLVDLGALPQPARSAAARALADEEGDRPFDLAVGPVFRVTLLRVEPEEHWLLLTHHHIVTDGWSVGVMIGDLEELYLAFSSGRPSPLPELPIQYADFAAWQRQWLTGEVLEGHFAYWRQQLAGLPALDLPIDRQRPPFQTYRGDYRPIRLSKELSTKLRQFALRCEATPFMGFFAAFSEILRRVSGQEDFAIGAYVANRTRPEIERLIGFFVNNLALRVDVSGDPSFRVLLERSRETTLGAYAHQDLPFQRLLQELKPERDLARTPLFQVMMVLQNAPRPPLELPGLTLSPLSLEIERAEFELGLWLEEGPEGFRGSLQFNRDLFEAPTVARMVEHLERLLEVALEEPERPLSQVSLLGEGERWQLLGEWDGWNSAATEAETAGLSVAGQIAAQAERTPHAVAVWHDGRSLSYAELQREAGRLAGRLRALGVGSNEAPVAVCLERSPEQIAAILGVLAAGGFYLPLDPGMPPERLALMMEDAGAGVLVSESRLVAELPRLPEGLTTVLLDAEDKEDEEEGGSALPASVTSVGPAAVDPRSPAYMIYTSGSTGKPKGVVVPHGALSRFVAEAVAAYGLGPSDRVLQFASFAFDASVEEIFPCLVAGGRLVLRTDAMLGSADGFLYRCGAWGITVLDLPTAYWHEITAALAAEPEDAADLDDLGDFGDFGSMGGAGGIEIPASLRLVILGGERALAEALSVWSSRVGPRVKLVNTYGPTEATVVATRSAPLDGTFPPRARREVPIGRPLPGVRARVLDRDLQPVPIGVSGELCLGGGGLARGYLGRPDLTAERFVPDPFTGSPGERLYRTGDLVRRRPDGVLEFVGRVDRQVKVRGVRIEPGEIEAALAAHPGVAESAVVAREDRPGERRLVAFVVPLWRSDSQGISSAGLRAFLGERLPAIMVPSAFSLLESLPRTPSGKIDRAALAGAEVALDLAREEKAVPRTPFEEILAGIWSEVLGLEAVGVDENFFELGGHSLLATQVLARVEHSFGIPLSLREMLQNPTVAGFARRVEARHLAAHRETEAPPEPASAPIPRIRRDGALPLSFAQERFWTLSQKEPDSSISSMDNVQLALRLEGELRVPDLARALGAVIARHEALRTRFETAEGQPVQVIEPAETWPEELLPVVDLSALPLPEGEAEARRLALEEARRTFDLSRGPVLRLALLRLGESDHALVAALPRIAGDPESIAIFLRELSTFYGAFREGRTPALPPLPIQMADFAAWQRRRLSGGPLEAELGYWRRRLAGQPARLALPTDLPRSADRVRQNGRLGIVLDADLAQRLRRLARREGATLFMTLLAAFQALLGRLAGQGDVSVGTPVSGRRRLETEGLIGFFHNTLILRFDVGANSFLELLGRAREAVLGAYAHQELPFEKLVGELRPEGGSLFQAMFALQAAPLDPAGLSGLRSLPLLESGEAGWRPADLDLSLTLFEQGPAGALEGAAEYDAGLFAPETVQRWLEAFERLVAAVAEEPDRPVSELLTRIVGEPAAAIPQASEADLASLLQELDRMSNEEAQARLDQLQSVERPRS